MKVGGVSGGGVEATGGSPEVNAGLLARIEDLEARLPRLERERDQYRQLYTLAREEIAQLKRGLVGKKAERFADNDAQLTLAVLGLMQGEQEAQEEKPPPRETRVPEHLRRKPVRKPLPEDLPRVTVEVTPPEVEREGLDAFEVIGEQRREVIERRPASAVVVEVVRRSSYGAASAQTAQTQRARRYW